MNRAALSATLLSCLLLIAGCETVGDLVNRGGVRVERTNIGEVELIVGAPLVLRSGTMIRLIKGSKIHVKDVVFTGEEDKVRFKMIDGTRIALGNDSQFVFHIYSYRNPAPIARMSFTEGSFRISTDRFMRRAAARFEVTTPLAVIGVRGTDFWGGYIFGDNTLDVALLSEGGIYVSNEFGTVDITERGFGTTVTFSTAPSVPEEWSQPKAFRAAESTAL